MHGLWCSVAPSRAICDACVARASVALLDGADHVAQLVETAVAVVLEPVGSVIEEAWPILTDARLCTDVNAIVAFAKVLSRRGTA
jgi:hypothetical protein